METQKTNGVTSSNSGSSGVLKFQAVDPKPPKKETLDRQLDRMTGEGGPCPQPAIPASAPFWETKNSITTLVRAQTVELLQIKLAESLDLYGRIKNAHWNVKGPHFIALHKLLDEIAAECSEFSDLIAERITQLGGTAQGSLQQAAQNTTLPLHELAAVNGGQDYVDSVSHALAAFSDSTRNAVLKIDHCDPVTADILTGITRGVDKNLWFVEAHTQKKTPDTCN